MKKATVNYETTMIQLANNAADELEEDEDIRATQESLKRSFQQSISAAILVSLAHKRYERRRLGAIEIEKIVRSLASPQVQDYDRIKAILLLLSDDYIRSSNEDARKGGVVALASCGIGMNKADDTNPDVIECKDLILASVVHCCQDHNQVRTPFIEEINGFHIHIMNLFNNLYLQSASGIMLLKVCLM